MANKLELTWYGKDGLTIVEPRILLEDAARSNCTEDPDTKNILYADLSMAIIYWL